MNRWQQLASAAILVCAVVLGGPGSAAAQTRPAQGAPEGEMRFALYVTILPAWLDPGETGPDNLTSFWMLYALHDALVKPMPGNPMAPSLAEAWTESADKRVYEFKLRAGLKFHNGDPFTADDVKFSFERAKGAQLKQKVKEVVAVDPHRVQFVLREPWPDFMAIYGTLASAAGWITPKSYFEKVGADALAAMRRGEDPGEAERARRARSTTLAEALESHLSGKTRSGKTEQGYRYALTHYLPDWMPREVETIADPSVGDDSATNTQDLAAVADFKAPLTIRV